MNEEQTDCIQEFRALYKEINNKFSIYQLLLYLLEISYNPEQLVEPVEITA